MMRIRRAQLLSSVLLALLLALGATAFAPHYSTSTQSCTARTSLQAWKDGGNNKNQAIEQSRRTWLSSQALGIASLLTASLSSAAQALVYVDPDRYGDKELQVGIVNKVRQAVRNVVLQDPKLAPLFLEIAIQDALSYSTATQAGGPNGQIVPYILQTVDKASPLLNAAQELVLIKSKLQRSTEITMADVVTFAGAEAIESLGGPRIVVQLGKLDLVSPDEPKSDLKLYDLRNGPETIDAFQKAGLTEREVTLLFGAMASMTKVLASVDNSATATDEDDDDEPNEMGDPKVDFPSSFGAPSQIYGERLGKMNDGVFKDELALQKKKQATGVWANDVVGEWTMRYSKGGFFKDLPEAFSRLARVGSTGRWEA